MRSDRPRFRYSSYWGTWSLVLTTRHLVGSDGKGRPGLGRTVEIDLSPVNGWDRADAAHLAKVRDLNVRVHCTSPSPRDRLERELPVEVQATLAAEIGWDLLSWLLDPQTEILGLVNWAKHARFNNGGASLRQSAWGHLAHLIPPARASDTTRRLVEHFDLAA
jgi:hypothetical protein